MSIHRSLRTAGALAKHRNVLSRVERIRMLEEQGKWHEGQNAVTCLPKVRSIKVKAKKKAKKEEEGAEAAAGEAAGAAPAAAAPAAAPAPGKK